MEFKGHTQTANYISGTRAIPIRPPDYNITSDATPVDPISTNNFSECCGRRQLTTLPWRPATFYKTCRVNLGSKLTSLKTAPVDSYNALSSLTGIKVPPVYSAARNALYTRYTPNDWLQGGLSTCQTSDRVRTNAERVRYDTVRLGKELDDKTKRGQEDVGKQLGQRLCDINFWKKELDRATGEMAVSQQKLNECKRVAQKVLAETENPLHIAQECIYNREKRQGIDLVHDQPEKDLVGEIQVIKSSQDKINRMVEKFTEQFRRNHDAQTAALDDSRDKFISDQLDSAAHTLNNNSTGLEFHNGVESVDNCFSVPETWARFSNDTLRRCEAERAASDRLRAEMEDTLNECCNDMWKKWSDTNIALSQRVQETTDARNKVQDQLGRVLQEIFDMEKNIEFIKQNIEMKEKPLKVAQTRLDIRLRRPNMELCRDSAHQRLVEEVKELHETIESLKKKLREAETALQHLLRNKAQLENDLNIKNKTLFIDQEKCLGLRKTFPIPPRLVF